jgi:heme/copper-type cytochrome/quinol oxidase subunit 1
MQNLIVLAVLQFIITFGTSMISLLSQEGVTSFSDVSQAALWSAGIGALVGMATTIMAKLQEPPAPEE